MLGVFYLCSFDSTDVDPVQAAQLRQALLRHTLLQAKPSHQRTKLPTSQPVAVTTSMWAWDGKVDIFHVTRVVEARHHEAIYANMPVFGLVKAREYVPEKGRTRPHGVA